MDRATFLSIVMILMMIGSAPIAIMIGLLSGNYIASIGVWIIVIASAVMVASSLPIKD